MLTLTLIRHAKSSWDDSDLSDFERPLAKRGLKDAPRIAQALKQMAWQPQKILTSPSKRTLQTLSFLTQTALIPEGSVQTIDEIYHASYGDLLEILSRQNNGNQSLALVGHNPSLNELTRQLTGVNLGNLPTCGVAKMVSDGDHWSDINDIHFKLVLLLTPKGLQGV